MSFTKAELVFMQYSFRHKKCIKSSVDNFLENLSKYGLYTRRTIVRRELARTRANSRELGRTPREFASSSPTPTLRRTPPNVRRSTPNVRRSSAEFARVRPSSRVLRRELANGSPENSFAGRNLNQRSPRTRFAANVVRRERGSSRTTFAANDNFGELVRQKLLENADYSSLSRTSSPPANCCSPRTDVRGGRTYDRGPPQAKLKELSGKWSNSSSRRGAA